MSEIKAYEVKSLIYTDEDYDSAIIYIQKAIDYGEKTCCILKFHKDWNSIQRQFFNCLPVREHMSLYILLNNSRE